MRDPQATIRPARLSDAAVLAEFVNMAGEGLPFYLWDKMAAPGEDPWEVGRKRAVRVSGSFSYRNAFVFESGGEPVACLIGYPLPDEPEAIDYNSLPAIFVPLQELENLAPRTWYVNALATRPDQRGNGYGRELLSLAERLARESNRSGTSLIVADTNVDARRLYRRSGYEETAERRMVKEGWAGPGQNWVLLVKSI